jgi:hypothetical protein
MPDPGSPRYRCGDSPVRFGGPDRARRCRGSDIRRRSALTPVRDRTRPGCANVHLSPGGDISDGWASVRGTTVAVDEASREAGGSATSGAAPVLDWSRGGTLWRRCSTGRAGPRSGGGVRLVARGHALASPVFGCSRGATLWPAVLDWIARGSPSPRQSLAGTCRRDLSPDLALGALPAGPLPPGPLPPGPELDLVGLLHPDRTAAVRERP